MHRRARKRQGRNYIYALEARESMRLQGTVRRAEDVGLGLQIGGGGGLRWRRIVPFPLPLP